MSHIQEAVPGTSDEPAFEFFSQLFSGQNQMRLDMFRDLFAIRMAGRVRVEGLQNLLRALDRGYGVVLWDRAHNARRATFHNPLPVAELAGQTDSAAALMTLFAGIVEAEAACHPGQWRDWGKLECAENTAADMAGSIEESALSKRASVAESNQIEMYLT